MLLDNGSHVTKVGQMLKNLTPDATYELVQVVGDRPHS